MRFCLLLLFTLLFTSSLYFGEVDLKVRVREVYLDLVRAEREGADVSGVAVKLDEALQLIVRAEGVSDPVERSSLLSRAEALIDEVEASIPGLIEAGRFRVQVKLIINVALVVFFLIAIILAYFWGPRFLWGLWLRFRGDWRVKGL